MGILCSLVVTLYILFCLSFSLKKVPLCISVKLEPNNDMQFSREIQEAVLLLRGVGIIHRLC